MRNLMNLLKHNANRIIAMVMAVAILVSGVHFSGVLSQAGEIQPLPNQKASYSYELKSSGNSSWKSIVGTTGYGIFTLTEDSTNKSSPAFCIAPGVNINEPRGTTYKSSALTGSLAKYYKAAIHFYEIDSDKDISKNARYFMTQMCIWRVKHTRANGTLGTKDFENICVSHLKSFYNLSETKAKSLYAQAETIIFRNGGKNLYVEKAEVIKWDDGKSGQMLMSGVAKEDKKPFKISIKKEVVNEKGLPIKDADLSGFVFKVYSDKDCSKQVKTVKDKEVILTTDSKGEATSGDIDFETYGNKTLYVKETETKNATPKKQVQSVTATMPQETYNVNFTNVYQPTTISVEKQDLQNNKLAGAGFTLYRKKGTKLIKVEGELFTSAENGYKVSFSTKLYPTKLGNVYVVKETTNPKNNDGKIYKGKYYKEFTVTGKTLKEYNEIAKNLDETPGHIDIIKQDSATGEALSGAEFKLVYKVTNSASGISTFKEIGTFTEDSNVPGHYFIDISAKNLPRSASPITVTPYVVETKMPANHFGIQIAERSGTEQYRVGDGTTNNGVFTQIDFSEVNRTITVELDNYQVIGHLKLVKKDSKTGKVLPGAIYQLYETNIAGNMDFNGDSNDPVLIDEKTTNENGEIYFTGLSQSKHYALKEVEAPEGYILDNTPIIVKDLDKIEFVSPSEVFNNYGSPDNAIKQGFAVFANNEYSQEANSKTDFEKVIEAENKPVEASLEINKTGVKPSGDSIPLEGAVFSIYDAKAIEDAGEDPYDFDTSKYKAVQTQTTNSEGKTTFNEVGIGKWVTVETNAPKNFLPCENYVFEVTKEDNGKVFKEDAVDNYYSSMLKIVKKDKATGKTIKVAGATFKIFDIANNKYLTMERPSEQTEEDGITAISTITEDSWKTDESGSVVLPKALPVGTYRLEEINAPEGYKVNNTPVEFQIDDENAEINDVYEVPLTTVDFYDDSIEGTIMIEKTGEQLTGLTEDGNFIYEKKPLAGVKFRITAREDILAPYDKEVVLYEKGSIVKDNIETDQDGKATVSGLPLGEYIIEETETVEGFVLDDSQKAISLKHEKGSNEDVTLVYSLNNKRQVPKIKVFKKDSETEKLLPGATFVLYANEDIKSIDGETLYEKGAEIESGTTGADGTYTFGTTKELPIAKYYIKETKAPKGYATAKDVVEFSLEAAPSNKKEIEYSFVIYDDITKTEVKKTDITSGEEIEGASLKVWYMDENGKEVIADEWVSEKKEHLIQGLEVGREYTLTETMAPDGYVTAKDIKFTIKDTGDVQKQEMKDDYTKLSISKSDIVTGDPVLGATLQIIDKNGVVIEEWVTDGEEHYIEKIPVGTYTLREKIAPTDQGYARAEDMEFTVKDTGEIQKVDMKDDYTRISVSKVTLTGGAQVLGAILQLLNENGEVIEEWQTDGKEHIIEKLPVGTYTLHEVQAPDGYMLADDIEIEVTDTPELKHVVMYDDIVRGRIKLTKYDATSNKTRKLANAVYGVFDEDENLVTTITTGADGTGTSDKLEPGTYYVKEKEAPEHFEVSTKTYKVKLNSTNMAAYESGEQKLEVALDVEDKPEIETGTPFFAPKTGEGAFSYVVLIIAILSSLGLIVYAVKPSKKRAKVKVK